MLSLFNFSLIPMLISIPSLFLIRLLIAIRAFLLMFILIRWLSRLLIYLIFSLPWLQFVNLLSLINSLIPLLFYNYSLSLIYSFILFWILNHSLIHHIRYWASSPTCSVHSSKYDRKPSASHCLVVGTKGKASLLHFIQIQCILEICQTESHIYLLAAISIYVGDKEM